MQLLSKNEPVNADAFFPVLIFNIICANPPNLISTVKYIQHFRPTTKMQHESGYLFASSSFC
jgi:hypothetical protein